MLVTAMARLRYVSIPARKMRFVANTVKGLPVQKALDILNFTPRLAARHIAKTLKSAAANALSEKGTDNLRPETLVIKNISVDEAPTMKRIRFQSMGRVYRVRKRFCHLTVRLEALVEDEMTAKSARQRAAAAEKPAEGEAAAETKTKAKAGAKKKTSARATGKGKNARTGAAKTKKTTKASAPKKTAKSSKAKGAAK